MENSDQGDKHSCFREWMNLQERDLSELLQALNHDNKDHAPDLSELVDKNIKHFEEYFSQRDNIARDDIYPYFSPTWCTSLEGSMLWFGGFRPSIFIRLVYAQCGDEISKHLDEVLNGGNLFGLGNLSGSQLNAINTLHLQIVRQEDMISKKLAYLQEDMADRLLAIIAKESQVCSEAEVEAALNVHEQTLIHVLHEADNLRLHALKELTGTLTAYQAVEFLAAGKKLHLCIHEWGRKRDQARKALK